MDITLGSLEFSAFMAGSLLFYSTLKKQQSIQQTLEFMVKATVFTPSLLKKVMQTDGPLSYQKSIRNFKEGKDFSEGYAFLEGFVKNDRPLTSALDRESEMIISNISTESIFSNNNKLNEGEGTFETRYVNEFELGEITHKSTIMKEYQHASSILTGKDIASNNFESQPGVVNLPKWKLLEISGSEGKNKTATVILNNLVNYVSALKFIDSATHVRSLTGLEKFLSWALFCVKLFLSMSNVGKRITGFRVGSRKIERGIILGQFIVLYGKVFFDRMNNQLKVTNPKYILQDKIQLINKLRRLSIKGSRNLALMSFFMALFGTMFIRRMVRVAKAYALKIERQQELRSQDKLHKVSELMTEDFKCIFCRRIAKNVIVKPCMHMFCCQGCYPKKVASGGCAVCGKTIEDKVNIYVV